MDLALDHLPSSTIELSSTCESASSSPRSRMISPAGRPRLAVTSSIRASSLGQKHRRGPPPPLTASTISSPGRSRTYTACGHQTRKHCPMSGAVQWVLRHPYPPRPSPRGVAASPPPAVVNSVRVSKIVRGSPPPLPPRRSPHGFAPNDPASTCGHQSHSCSNDRPWVKDIQWVLCLHCVNVNFRVLLSESRQDTRHARGAREIAVSNSASGIPFASRKGSVERFPS